MSVECCEVLGFVIEYKLVKSRIKINFGEPDSLMQTYLVINLP
jgi:hypothetical protein